MGHMNRALLVVDMQNGFCHPDGSFPRIGIGLEGAEAAVANAAVVPSPDETRGNVVKAFIVLASGHEPSPALEDDIRSHVRQFLAPYEYPKEIEFIDALPMTTTGKVQRRVLRDREAKRKVP